MNNDDQSANQLPDDRRAIDRVCREFEKRFRSNPNYKIEDLIDSIQDILRSLAPGPEESLLKQPILNELICLEMDLRFDAGQEFDQFEYYFRFPDCVDVIDESLKRLDLLDDESSFQLTRLATLTYAGTDDSSDDFVVDQKGTTKVPSQLGPYTQIEQIGEGNFGIVCGATDSRSGERVALKFPRQKTLDDDKKLRLFLEEAERARQLDHPGIVKTYSLEQNDGFLFIVQQLVVGTDLLRTINSNRGKSQIAELVAHLADALAYAHRNDIWHRDLKPANILLDEQGKPYIADFGLALHESVQLDAPNVICGTPPYMAPELVLGLTKDVDGRTDIWSLGVILYELLAGKRPFRGKTSRDIFDQIETKDPRPLREIDSSIDRELQRICLKCLFRRKSERYLTADELADDLRHWMKRPTQTISAGPAAAFVPKGLRSYGAEDADFFLDLLPGPRDRENVPASIRFWTVRSCEPVADENRVPVGTLYGPSGSGKSSFVKAGLIPHIKDQVETIYVESTQKDTEVRLMKSLRQRFPNLPENVSLPQMLAGLGRGRWQESPRKVLIVLDQFEQWLSGTDEYNASQLARGLRHCDGESLQCLLLVRDDFWLALTRFADALEMDLLEGHNAQAIDLFDREHAKKVLIKLGQAYKRLPVEAADFSNDGPHTSFLDKAIDQLAVGNYVICVRLTVFAEMFKGRDWTLDELDVVGGVEGVGQKFLEDRFGTSAATHRHQFQKQSVQGVLEALLPDAGSDIRGAMQPEQALMSAAGYENQPNKFRDLIKTLDTELRLITRTDPDLSPTELETGSAAVSEDVYYQLTHDYLVRSIRDWLNTDLGKTPQGRALMRLRELAAQATPGETPRYLPTNLEWLGWRYRLRNQQLRDNERAVMRAGRNQFLRSFGTAAAIVLIATVIISFLIIRDRANNLVANLVGQEFDQAPDLVAQLERYPSFLVLPQLRRIYESEDSTDAQKRKALLGLLQFESHRAATIVENITRANCGPEELKASVDVFGEGATPLRSPFWEIMDAENADPRSRFRAAMALLELRDATIAWNDHAKLIGTALIREPTFTHAEWIKSIALSGDYFTTKFKRMFLDTDERTSAVPMAMALYACYSSKHRLDELVPMIAILNDVQFDALLSIIEDNSDEMFFFDELERAIENSTDLFQQTKLGMALFRLGEVDFVAKAFSDETNDFGRAVAINFAHPKRIRLYELRTLYESQVEVLKTNDSYRRSLLLTLAGHASESQFEDLDDWMISIAIDRLLHDKDAGCFSAAELLLRRLGFDEIAKLKKERRVKHSTNGILGNVFINSRLQSFSIIALKTQSGDARRFAISTMEITNREMNDYLNDVEDVNHPMRFRNSQDPYKISDIRVVYGYCNWLSKSEFGPGAQVYPQSIKADKLALTPFRVDRLGYRIPSVAEWNAACSSNLVFDMPDAVTEQFQERYAWLYQNSRGETQSVGLKLPNDQGLFDSFGNLQEICQSLNTNVLATLFLPNGSYGYVDFFEMGFSARYQGRTLSTRNFRKHPVINPTQKVLLGFRIVREIQ